MVRSDYIFQTTAKTMLKVHNIIKKKYRTYQRVFICIGHSFNNKLCILVMPSHLILLRSKCTLSY